MISVIRCLGVGAVLSAAMASAGTGQQTRPFVLSAGRSIATEYDFAEPVAGAISLAGDLYVADDVNSEILKIGPDGSLQWKVGRKGSGPGEYRHPYRLASRGDSGVVVLDWGSGRVTLLSAEGKVDETHTLPFGFNQIDGFERLRDGRFIVAGMTTAAAAVRGSIHVFSDSMRHQYSFGPWAQATDSAVALYTGSGGISIDQAGRLVFTRKRPYEIHTFDVSGSKLGVTSVSAPTAYDLDDLIEVKVFNGRSFRGLTPRSKDVEMPLPAVSIGSQGYLSGRSTFTTVKVDFISRTGSLIDSVVIPHCDVIFAVDTVRSMIYCRTMVDDIPGIMRVRYTVSPP